MFYKYFTMIFTLCAAANAFCMELNNSKESLTNANENSQVISSSEYNILMLPKNMLFLIIKMCITSDMQLEDPMYVTRFTLFETIRSLSRTNKLFNVLTNSDLMAKYILHYFEGNKQPFFSKMNLKYELVPGKIDPNQSTLLKKTNLQKRFQEFKQVQFPLPSTQKEKDNLLVNRFNFIDQVILCVCNGADINTDSGGYTALILASDEGHEEIAEFLINKKADINVKTEYYNSKTALSCAAKHGHKNIVALLLKNGADISINKWQAIYNAEYKNHDEILDLLISSFKDFDVQDDEKKTLLMRAAERGHIKTVKKLIEKGANVNTANDYGLTALMQASSYNRREIIKLLLKAGADINAKTNYGHTALMDAAQFENLDNVVPLLIENGADVLAIDDYGNTAFRYATKNGNIENMTLLIKKGAVFDDQTKSGWTPLMLAAHYGRKQAVEFLIKKGVDIHAKTEDGETALDLAQNSITRKQDINSSHFHKETKILRDIVALLKKEMNKNNSNNNAIESTDEKDFICPICMDKIEDKNQIIKTSCDHKFCQNCLDNWTKQKSFYQKESSDSEDLAPTCPLCRATLNFKEEK